MSGMIGVQTPVGGSSKEEASVAGSGPPMPDSSKLPRQPFRPSLEVKNFSSATQSKTEINNSGIFYVDEDLIVQQKRMESMQRSNPEKAKNLFQSYTQMVVLSSVGDLNAILGIMASMGAGPPPAWFAVKMFQTAVMALNLEVPKFMVKNGFNPR